MTKLLAAATAVLGAAACGSVRSTDGPMDAAIDAAPPFASCAGMPATCGAQGNDDCCASPAVPGGSFDRSYDLAGDATSGDTSAPATVSAFRLDKYEVTVGRFRAFVEAGMGLSRSAPAPGAGAHEHLASSGWDASWNASLAANTLALVADLKCDATYQTWTDAAAANEHRPINCVSWYDAMAFCLWDGGYLPSEAEWNYAAAGGDQQRAYPWSSSAGPAAIEPSDASYSDAAGAANCIGDGMAGCALTDLLPVGSRPAGDGRWGQSDLAGNVFEWLLDWQGPYATPCTDCASLAPSPNRRLRGGAFASSITDLRSGVRNSNQPAIHVGNVGFRCARAP